VPVNDNPGGEMSGGITSGMRDGSAHVLRCLKVNFWPFFENLDNFTHFLPNLGFFEGIAFWLFWAFFW
jgi:hypothetical protein